MPDRQFREEEVAHSVRVRRSRPQGVYLGPQLQMFRPQACKLSQASKVFGADRAELLRVIFINSAKIVALRQSPKVLILGVEREDWE
jgi:hypothetical protein